MIETTQAFFDNSIYKYRNTQSWITINLFDFTAKTDITSVSVSKNRMFNASQIYDGVYYIYNYATLEQNEFYLDGSMTLMPDTITNEQIGWWTQLSKSDGTFTNTQEITVELDNRHSTAGLTINYDQFSYPINSTCKWYQGSTLLDTATLTDQTTNIQQFVNSVDGYDKIVITIDKAKNYAYVKMSEIDYGLIQTFTADQLQGGTVREHVSLLSNTLSPDELTFSVIDYDNTYNVFNPEDLFKYFKVGQPCRVTGGVLNRETNEYETISMGIFYINNFDIENGLLKISAYGVLNILNASTFYSPFYINETIENIAGDILDGYEYYVHPNVASKTLTGYIPLGSKKEALKNLAIACGAVVKEGRDGKVYLYRNTPELSSNQVLSSETEFFLMGLCGQATCNEPIMPIEIEPVPYIFTVERQQRMSDIKSSMIGFYEEVDVTYKKYTQGASETLFDDDVITDDNGIGLIKYNSPVNVTSVSVTGATYQNFADCTIITGTANSVYSVFVTGNKYEISEYTMKCLSQMPSDAYDDAKLTMELNSCNELVTSPTLAKEIGDWYLSQLQRRKDIEFDWWSIATTEATDYVDVITSFDDKFELEISDIEYDLYDLIAKVKGIA
ncbi:MAG: hypothetical protein IJF87_06070 [Erysipelotrichaceae bacterium]|nr:hypothetical protein [Erysipelotrichaceae bacterium]